MDGRQDNVPRTSTALVELLGGEEEWVVSGSDKREEVECHFLYNIRIY